MWAFVILALLQVYSLGEVTAKHGTPKNEKYNAWYTIIGMIIFWTLIYFSGVFNYLQ